MGAFRQIPMTSNMYPKKLKDLEVRMCVCIKRRAFNLMQVSSMESVVHVACVGFQKGYPVTWHILSSYQDLLKILYFTPRVPKKYMGIVL